MSSVRNQLPRGQWSLLWQSGQMPFSRSKGHMLIVIGEGLGWVNVQTFGRLPIGWSILYYLAQLDRSTVERLVEEGVIHPALKLWEARALAARFQGKSLASASGKARVGERLRRLEDFVHQTLTRWTAAERQLARATLTRLAEQISCL